ncbi:serine hydrolase [Aliifodinibius salicampi]|uniref:Serine hydrolase n=1 Tax=Fodinibius salicampi TaxID=1920655 RepID=A0ABT3Q2J8_9BACT|nr:serine hydrolase [Fodinibius salicampi]MCW9714334.1 serine hydrolase [Fodinibius salicampi]
MKSFITSFCCLLVLTVNAFGQEPDQKEIPIAIGEEVNNTLTQHGSHFYSTELDSGQFVFGKANQQSVDVVVTVHSPKGEEVATFDGPARGHERFQFDTKLSGNYRIEVAPYKQEEGNYSFLVSTVEPIASDPDARVDQLMMAYSGNDVPGAEAMVIRDGEILFSEAYGMANLSYNIPFDVETRTNIGSTSKQFTAFGLLLLAEQDKLSLDDDVRDYIPELPEFEHTVTLRHLLTHTSGYREFLNTLAMTGRDLSSDLDREMIIKVVQRQPELQNKPGAQWNYNNTGYALIAEVINRVTDMAFPEYMKKQVFEPLGMNHTMVRKTQNQVVPESSQGYTMSKDGEYREVADLGGAMGAGGIYTTLGDLAKWIRNLEEPTVGSENIIRQMTTPYKLNNGQSTEYGLGLFAQEYRGLEYIHHGGSDLAHRSMLMYFPEIEAGVVTQSNNSSFQGDIAQKIADEYFGEHMEPKETEESGEEESFNYEPENFEPLTGRYELVIQPGFVLSFYRDGDRLYTQATGQPEVDITATSDSTFSLVGVNADITFHLNEDGTADSLTLHQNGNHIAKRIEWDPDMEQMKKYTGRYFSEEIETSYTIALEDSSLVLRHYYLDDITLSPGNEDSFSGEFPVTDFSFIRNEEDEITGFNASNGRTKNVFFEKKE